MTILMLCLADDEQQMFFIPAGSRLKNGMMHVLVWSVRSVCSVQM